MKRLVKIRLINWHRFQDETILFDDAVLLSGENGAGKSTILDAIQYVITCSKADFNKAAHEKGKRNLNSYIRCKTGREDHPFERTGAISAHIALEFWDEAKARPFIIGAVMDSATEEKEPNVGWYLLENKTLSDELFKIGNKVKSISAFQSTNRGIHTFARTITEAKKMIQNRFGRLEDKFFSLIPKALAFKPINNIKDFVYSYVLDQKEVKVDLLKENVRSYRELENTLEDVKKRISELEQIRECHDNIERYMRLELHQEYYIVRARKELIEQKQEKEKKEIRYLQNRIKELEQELNVLRKEKDIKEKMYQDLSIEMKSDSDYQALSALETRKSDLEEALEKDGRELKELQKTIDLALQDVDRLLSVRDVDACIRDYGDLLRNLDKCEKLSAVYSCLDEVITYKRAMYTKVQEKLAEIRVQMREKQEQDMELAHRIKELEGKRLIYPAAVILLQRAIQEEFAKVKRTTSPRVLCELLEISDKQWQNAVEGYMNTQRFYLLTEPEDFDLALSVYDRLRSQGKVYGVGLINTAKLEEYDNCPKGTLAEVVSSSNIWARRYINMILGKVYRCERYQDLKKYPVSITKQCMRYQNHVVSAIKPEIYKTPYIGAEAYKKQLEQCRKEKTALEQIIAELKTNLNNLQSIADPLDERYDIDLKYRLQSLENYRMHHLELEKCKEEMRKLKANTTLIQKAIRLKEVDAERKHLEKQIEQISRESGGCENKIENANEKIKRLSEELTQAVKLLEAAIRKLQEDLAACEKEYEKKSSELPLDKLIENYERSQKANGTLKMKEEDKMKENMRRYKIAHDFGASESMEGYEEFKAEYDKLVKSQLLEYEEKVYRARKAAEEEFREQFLSKLQENIKQAQNEFKELNKALKDIQFSKEKYEFMYSPKGKLKRYYDMIMSDFNIMQGESLFKGTFNEKHREVIDELFEKLSFDNENSEKVLEEFTDYRTYMDYDIKISQLDGGFMLYSKVSQEKSGGETQTPFYITIAASFMQLYRNSIGGDSIGLVMMDEAFNNMDDERISGVLSFMRNSNLQLIIAAPPDKIQYIGPSMKKVLLVLQEDRYSYVEDFTNETI